VHALEQQEQEEVGGLELELQLAVSSDRRRRVYSPASRMRLCAGTLVVNVFGDVGGWSREQGARFFRTWVGGWWRPGLWVHSPIPVASLAALPKYTHRCAGMGRTGIG
jgi:hypothetical protein